MQLIILLYSIFVVLKGAYSQLPCNLNSDDHFKDIKATPLYEGNDVGQYSKFDITYYNTSKIISNQKTEEHIGLFCKGSKPNPDEVDKDKMPNRWIEIPLESIGVRSRNVMKWLEQMGLNNTKIYADDTDSFTDGCIQGKIESKTILGLEKAENLSLVLTDSIKGADKSVDVKYKDITFELGHDNNELTPLRRLLWMKLIAAFFNMEKVVEDQYNTQSNSYKCHKQNLEKIQNRKQIGFVQYSKDDTNGKWKIVQNEYIRELVTDSGAFFKHIESPENMFKDSKKFQDEIKQYDIIIDLTNYSSDEQITIKSFKNAMQISEEDKTKFKFLNNKKLFTFKRLVNTKGYFDFDEAANTRPDLLIRDLIAAQYPAYNSSYSLTWLLNLSENKEPTFMTKESCKTPIYPPILIDGYNGCINRKNKIKNITDDVVNEYTSEELARENGDSNQSDNSDSLGLGGILGIVFGILLLIGAGMFIYWVIKKRKVTGGKPIWIHQLKTRKQEDQFHLLNNNE